MGLHADAGAGVGGRRHQEISWGSSARRSAPRAPFGRLGPFLDRIADRDVPQDPRQDVLPERFHFGRDEKRISAVPRWPSTAADCTLPAHRGRQIAGGRRARWPLAGRDRSTARRKAEAFDIGPAMSRRRIGRTGGPITLDGAGVAIGAGPGQVGAAGQQGGGCQSSGCPRLAGAWTPKPGPAHPTAPCRRRSRHRPVRRRSPVRNRLCPALETCVDGEFSASTSLLGIDVVELGREPFASEIGGRIASKSRAGRSPDSTASRTKRSQTGRQNRWTTTLCCNCSTRRRNSISPARIEEYVTPSNRRRLVRKGRPMASPGAEVVLDERAVGIALGQVGKPNVGAGRQGIRLPGSMPTVSAPFVLVPVSRPPCRRDR